MLCCLFPIYCLPVLLPCAGQRQPAMRLPKSLAAAAFAASIALPPCSRNLAFCLSSSRLPSQRGARGRVSTSQQQQPWSQQHRHRQPHRRRPRSMAIWPRMAFDPDVTPAALDAFHAWLTKSGVKIADNAALAGRSPLAGGRGLVTTKPLENGQTVLAIPQSLGLTASGLESSGIARHLAGYEGWTGDTGLIALQVLWERSLGDKSKMAPWIEVLPAQGELDIPLFWDGEDLALADASSTRVRLHRCGVDSLGPTRTGPKIARLDTCISVLHDGTRQL